MEDNSVIYRVGLWLLCNALPLTAIYLYTKFQFNPFYTFQDMAKTDIHYERLKGYGKITLYMHRIGLWFLCTVLSLTAIHLYTMFHFNPLSTF